MPVDKKSHIFSERELQLLWAGWLFTRDYFLVLKAVRAGAEKVADIFASVRQYAEVSEYTVVKTLRDLAKNGLLTKEGRVVKGRNTNFYKPSPTLETFLQDLPQLVTDLIEEVG